MILTMIAISIIDYHHPLPPGNYLELHRRFQAQGESVDPQKIAFLKQEYGLDAAARTVPPLGRRHAKGDFAIRSSSICR
jgi:hypothetical protein